MSKSPDLTLVVVNWNGKELLKDCIPSIYSSTRRSSLQVIVVDNNSDDDSVSWCHENHEEVEVIELSENRGFSGGNNVGLEKAEGRYVMLLNNDTIVQEAALDILVKYMDEHPEVGGCGPRLLNKDGSLQRSVRSFPTLWTEFCQEFCLSALFPSSHVFARYYMSDWAHDENRKVNFVIGAALLMRRSVLDEIGFLDDKSFYFFYEETDWCRRLKKARHAFVYVNDAKIIHLGGASYVHRSSEFHSHLLDSRYSYHRKHNGSAAVSCLWMIHVSSGFLFSILFGFLSAFGFKANTTRPLQRRYLDTLRYHLAHVFKKQVS
jgi:GT2 family glycosyltransferase